jgi:hypothetical protein
VKIIVGQIELDNVAESMNSLDFLEYFGEGIYMIGLNKVHYHSNWSIEIRYEHTAQNILLIDSREYINIDQYLILRYNWNL